MAIVWTILGAIVVAWLLWPRDRVQRRDRPMNSKTVHVVAMIKQATGETYAYSFTDTTRRETLMVIGRQAVNPDLSLDWHDAWLLEEKICLMCKSA